MRYRDFVKDIYDASLAKQRLYPTLKAFNEHYDLNFGPYDWFKSLSGKILDQTLTMDVVCTNVISFGRAPEIVPDMLKDLANTYGLIPDEQLMSLSGDAWLVLFQACDYGSQRANVKRA